MSDFDLIVVGGGPGGYVAAIRAAQLGFKTALVEKADLGGVCLNWGCIPTKALLRGADIAHTLKHAAHFGFDIGTPKFDLAKLVGHSRSTAKRLSQGINYLMNKNAVTVIRGHAKITAPFTLAVSTDTGEQSYRADHIILATGAHARDLPNIKVDGKLIWGAREAMTPTALPERLLVIGAGAIGVEFASLYNDLGSEVTLVEAANQIVPVEDSDVSAQLAKSFRERGIRIHTDTTVNTVEHHANSVTAELKTANGNEKITVDRVILAVGISGNIQDLGLEELHADIDRGFIKTDPFSKTNIIGLYAIGDVAGPPWLAHKASHEAVICVERIAGMANTKALRKDRVPGCTYCRPQIASVGMTEAKAKAAGRNIRVGRFNLNANGKALAIDESVGFVKTIFDAESGELLGAHMIGAEVTEQIQGFCIAQQLEATEHELANAIFAHPTLSESMHESVLDSLGIAIHQ
ncbi:dihydrolipoyl dehydrogenase [Zhongshania sp. BJYM1]|uniref:dihydrolipoyl dehydrogenase n=1 Tax=Zhongshania aquatica TaxID=2965069 RepID=UPI0022B3DEC3|nr:dihydrolipoyl dehydrogenase [Marortus sp. BJYM1]